jgi:2-oxoglutarate/2-oxoacid ferredoxin oxidoreductase subunit beta
VLRKIAADYNPCDRSAALAYVRDHSEKGEIVTGLLYIDADANDLHAHHNTTQTPLNALGERELCPGSATLEKINASLR